MSMDKSAADAYVYAKSSGMLVRSFTKKRSRMLFSARSLHELWTMLFKKEVPPVPETLLAKEIELEAFAQFVKDYDSLLRCYSKPAPLLISLLRSYEYSNLKEAGSALASGSSEMPAIVDISPYGLINWKKWPDLKLMTAGTDFSWFNKIPEFSERMDTDYRLDCQYVEQLWKAARKTDAACRSVILELLGEKIRIDNAVWALRLKLYYEMPRDQILKYLAYSSPEHDEKDTLVQEAVKILDFETDNHEKWASWKYSFLLNPHEEGNLWNVDPGWIYNAYKKRYVEKAWRLFHLHPFTDCPLVCWFIIKRNELDLIRTAAESIRLNVAPAQAMNFAGILEE